MVVIALIPALIMLYILQDTRGWQPAPPKVASALPLHVAPEN